MSKLMTYILSHNDAIHSTFQLQIQTLMSKNPSPFTQLAPCILQNLKQKFLNYDGTPFCFVEISHRSRFYDNLNNLAVDVIKKYFNAEQYEVVFMPPGSAMSTIYFNFVEPDTKILFHCGGSFSDRYYQQMRKYHDKVTKAQKLQDIKPSLMTHSTCPHIIHYNKIDQGIEISPELIKSQIPQQNIKNSIIVNNISYSFPWTQIQPIHEDILYFESQSGFSIPGFTVMLVKKQLMANMKVRENCPDMFDLLMMIKMKSVVNTPFTLCTLVLYENIKYALENKVKIAQDVIMAKKSYAKMLTRAGFRMLENQNEGKQREKEAFNFIRAYYGMREEMMLENIKSMGWINKQNQCVCIFVQSPNRNQPQFPAKPENEAKTQ